MPKRTVIKAQSDKEKEMAIKKWARTDKPNPFTYKTEQCEKALSTNRRQTSWAFSRGARDTFSGKLLNVNVLWYNGRW